MWWVRSGHTTGKVLMHRLTTGGVLWQEKDVPEFSARGPEHPVVGMRLHNVFCSATNARMCRTCFQACKNCALSNKKHRQSLVVLLGWRTC